MPAWIHKLPRRASGTLAIVALASAWALLMHPMGWGQTANYTQIEAISHGRADIDANHWQTKDKAWIVSQGEGHFYSVKAPGLALMLAPAHKALDISGAQSLADEAVENARGSDTQHWEGNPQPPYIEAGYSAKNAFEASVGIESETPFHWVLTLLGAVAPAVLMLFVVRAIGDRFVPGYGAAAALTLGAGTMLMTFASELFAHVIAATIAFGAFALLFKEREGPSRPALVAAAGLLAGLAVTFEYPLGLVGAVLFVYALTRPGLSAEGGWMGSRAGRAVLYSAGAVLGTAPLFVFNQWAFGDPLTFAYSDAVSVQGLTGHAELGLNDDGFFGITVPKTDAALELLLASRGLLAITPVILLGVAGAIALRRGQYRAEANVILAVAAIYFLYNAGYWLPFGGGTPGPRFLIPALPFVALGLASAWKRWPALTLALAIPSMLFSVSAAVTHPLIGDGGTAVWGQWFAFGDFEHTVLTAMGLWWAELAIAPVLIAVGLAIMLAARATPIPLSVRGVVPAVIAVVAWAGLSAVGPDLVGDPVTPLGEGQATLGIIAAGALASLGALWLLGYRERRALLAKAPARAQVPLTDSTSPALGESSA